MEGGILTGDLLGLPKEFIKDLYQLIHDESIRRQTEVMNKLPKK